MLFASASHEITGFVVMLGNLHWSQHHVMQIASSMPPLHYLGLNDQNFFVMWLHWCQCHVNHVMLPLLSCDTHGIANDTISFLRSGQLKWGVTWLLCSCDMIGTSISIIMMPMAFSMTSLHSLGQEDQNEVASWLFWSCDVTGTSTGITWC